MYTAEIDEDILNYWWLMAINGLLLLFCSITLIVWPGPSLHILGMAFGFCGIAFGLLGIIVAVMTASRQDDWGISLLALGLISVLIGIATISWVDVSIFVFYSFVALAFVFLGISLIVAGYYFRSEIMHAWLFMIAGGIEALLGFYLLAKWQEALLMLAWLFSAAFTCSSALCFVLALLMLHQYRHHITEN